MAKRTAVIDIGSNSVRLVIFEKTSRFAFHILHEAKSRVRISENAYKNNAHLQKEPQERAFLALQEFSYIIKEYKVTKTLCLATSALRDAPNKKDFINKVKQELNIHIKVINGEREAYLGGIAAANLLYLDAALSVDIGGGSTDLCLYENRKVSQTYSLNIGAVRLKELYFDNDDFKGAQAHIDLELKKLPSSLKHDTLIGIGGTIRSISNMIMQNKNSSFKKIHGFCYETADEKSYFEQILKADKQGLIELGVKEERLDTIQTGLLILTRLIKYFNSTKLVSSGAGIREGLFLSDLLRSQNGTFPKNYNPSVKSILDRFPTPKNSYLYKQSSQLFDLVSKELKLDEKDKPSFLMAIKLSQVGKEIDFYEAHRHAYYILLNGLNYGFSHQQTLLISSLVRYQRKKQAPASHLLKYEAYLPKPETLHALSYLMRLCIDMFNNFEPKKEIELSVSNTTLFIKTRNSYLLKERLNDLKDNVLLNIHISSH